MDEEESKHSETKLQSQVLETSPQLIDGIPEDTIKKYTALSLEDIKTFKLLGLTDLDHANEMMKKKKADTLDKWVVTQCGPQNVRERQQINVVLLGKTGAGKSSTANLIVGSKRFKESASTKSCTKHIQREDCKVDNVVLNIIDTPGFEDTDIAPAEICTEISKVMEEFSDGIDGLLFVFNMGNTRYTKDQEAAFHAMDKGLFGDGVINNCFVILTHIETQPNIESLSKFLEDEKKTAFGKLLIDKLEKRVIAVNNADQTVYGRNAQKENIINLILAQKGKRFSSEQFEHYQKEQLRLAGKLPEHIQFLAPELQKEVSAAIRPMEHQAVTELKDEQCPTRGNLVDTIVERAMEIDGVDTAWERDVRRAVEFTLDGVVERVIGSAYWDKLGLSLVLFAVPAGVGIASLMAPEFSPVIVATGAFIMETLRKELKAIEQRAKP